MRLPRRFITATAALLILLGSVCPAVCFAASEDSATQPQTSSTSAPPCHGSSDQPARSSRDSDGQNVSCEHCEEPAISVTAVLEIKSPESAIAPVEIQPAQPSLRRIACVNAQSHDPPTRNLLLVKNSFLL